MGKVNEKCEICPDVAAATVAPVVITWSSNEPTAAATQTISNGTVPTVAELGQYVANIQVVIAAIIADIVAIRTGYNS